ncbi:hypothetical protein FDI21_gp075 [Pseudomonas phage Noxifer]|uniref:Uncharacterized protein n=1 Tax=Pseudomonas phage Noxifer TaxID=2006684 RepID=A0A1Y0SZY7_9CAUD|nr:hypothetical protein FDI21_gp075 [Pseudomonas phage Noxifer]ARV77246.1 hypothetical protein NOXIFER_75 [Pseudomonas phage Noxifer]
MQDMFKERLGNRMPMEQLEQGLSIIALFEDVGFTAPFEPLQEIMEVGTSVIDNEQYVSRVLTCLSDSCDDLLKAFGVEVTESTPLQFKLDCGLTLIKLPNYYLPVEVLAIIESSNDKEATLAELIELTQGVIVEESLEYIYDVNDALIPKLAAEMRKKYELEEALNLSNEEIVIDRNRITNINRLLQDFRAKDHLTCLTELLDAGAKIGADYMSLVNQYVTPLTFMPADHMTIELLGLALFSNLPAEEWAPAAQKAAGEFTDLLSDHRKIEMALNEYKVFFEM